MIDRFLLFKALTDSISSSSQNKSHSCNLQLWLFLELVDPSRHSSEPLPGRCDATWLEGGWRSDERDQALKKRRCIIDPKFWVWFESRCFSPLDDLCQPAVSASDLLRAEGHSVQTSSGSGLVLTTRVQDRFHFSQFYFSFCLHLWNLNILLFCRVLSVKSSTWEEMKWGRCLVKTGLLWNPFGYLVLGSFNNKIEIYNTQQNKL